MQTINFKKFGILLAMMLVAGAALVGPVSAASVTTNDYKLRDGGTVTSTSTSYWAAVNTLDSVEAENLVCTAVLYTSGGSYRGMVTDTQSDSDGFTVSSNYGSPVSGGYVYGSFDGVDPNDSYYGLIQYLY